MITIPKSERRNPEVRNPRDRREAGTTGARRVNLPESEANCLLAGIDDWPERAHWANYSVAELAKSCEVTPRTLQRFFRATFGESPKRQLHRWRMERARGLLHLGKSVKQAATGVFYGSQSHFSYEFKKFHGFPPNARARLARKTH